MTSRTATPFMAAVIGGGPAGLIAAEVLAAGGLSVSLFDQMPTVGRKLLMAGRGGLNLTHSEPLADFLERYGAARDWLEPAIGDFAPQALIDWCHALGEPTFVGSSGRVFPRSMKASPLLRAWLNRLAAAGVRLQTRHRWTGWTEEGALRFAALAGERRVRPDVTILALGGASWPRLGTDGGWAAYLADQIEPFRPSNCGFTVAWSDHLRRHFAGRPLKRIALHFRQRISRGEAMVTETGIEGGAVYALSAALRDAIQAEGPVTLQLDLRPDLDAVALRTRLAAPRRGQSLSSFLRKQAGLAPEAIAQVQEALHRGADAGDLTDLIKALPLTLCGPQPIARAISSAGGVRRDALDAHFMVLDRPGVFAAGEMLDWEAPTGGYLLQACFSTGVAAAKGALAWLALDGGS
jgi:uncharacterized flavoprotein (TIGR03862 family)